MQKTYTIFVFVLQHTLFYFSSRLFNLKATNYSYMLANIYLTFYYITKTKSMFYTIYAARHENVQFKMSLGK